ncbi:MAG TPA: NAD(P)H-dependent oxidoreductase [Ruminiclostridium sp.]|nr:NAD(P)H-dependent oxidoreductase [Ruminiclostridium sp.]
MNKLLYIVANSKPEQLSSSETVGRVLVNGIMSKINNMVLEEIKLYDDYIPRPKSNYFSSRSKLVDKSEMSGLTENEQKDVQQMMRLCDQFMSASVYVLAAPMWSLSFPGVVKDYIDCILQVEKTIKFVNNRPEGLMNDRPRTFIYVQSSGANIPWIIRPALNKGLNYVEDIMKFIGISKFEELLADGTGTTEQERQEAIKDAEKKIEAIIGQIQIH